MVQVSSGDASLKTLSERDKEIRGRKMSRRWGAQGEPCRRTAYVACSGGGRHGILGTASMRRMLEL